MSERDEVLARWRLGEERLYPVAAVRPDLYEAAIGIVRSLADHLAPVPDIDALIATYRSSARDAELAEAGVSRDEVSPEMDLDMVRAAAYQVRMRELTQREAAERTETSIRRARAAGERTAILWSVGDRELWPPYRRVEMSVATGHAVSISVDMDPDTLTPRYALEGLELDPETGEAARAEPLVARREFSDPNEWRSAAEELRRRLLTI